MADRRISIARGPVVAGGGLLLAGYGVYLMAREGTWLDALPFHGALASAFPSLSGGGVLDWAPSLLFVLSFSLLSIGLFHRSPRVHWWPVGWTAVGILGEFLTAAPLWAGHGVFDWLDVVACMAAGAVGLVVANAYRGPESVRAPRMAGQVVRVMVSVVGVISMVATTQPGHSDEEGEADPVYLSWEDLRRPVAITAPEEVLEVAKVYKYNDYILLNSPNEGIHVIDNTDPRNPRNIAFLYIPGNLDMAVKDDILYADSYVDLVAIDISRIQSAREVRRLEDVFPYNEYQSIDNDVWLDQVDQSRGVVVAYVPR